MEQVLSQIRERRSLEVDQALMLIQTATATADYETQIGFLNIARQRLADPQVFKAWCQLLSPTGHVPLMNDVITALNHVLYRGMPFPEWPQSLSPHLQTLVGFLTTAELRDESLRLVQFILLAEPQSADNLANAWSLIEKSSDQDMALRFLYDIRHVWPQADSFLAKVFHKNPQTFHANWRDAVTLFLLEKGKLELGLQIQLLHPNEPEALRFEILDTWNRRFQNLTTEQLKTIRQLAITDSSPRIRTQAVSLLALSLPSHPELIDVLMQRFQTSTDEWELIYLQTLLKDMASSPATSAVVTPALLQQLTGAKNIQISKRSLQILYPLLSDSGALGQSVSAGFIETLRHNLDHSLTMDILEAIRGIAVTSPQLPELLLKELSKKSDDQCVAQMIELLSELPNLNPSARAQLEVLVKQVLTSTQAPLRAAGLTYLLHLRLTPESNAMMASGISLLTDNAIDERLRSDFGRKLAKCTNLSSEAVAQITKIVRTMPEGRGHMNDARLQLTQLLAAAQLPSSSDGEPPWDDWMDRVQNGKPIDGMVPAVYLQFEKNPAKGAALLKSMLFQHVYAWPRLVNKDSLLHFLLAHNAVDAEIANYAFDFLLTKDDAWGDMDFHLMLLKNYPEITGELKRVWLVFERAGNSKRINPTLLREVMCLSTGSDRKLADHFRARMPELKTASDLEPYLHFLGSNASWVHSKELLAFLEYLTITTPALEESGNRDQINELRLLMGLDQLRPGLKKEVVKKAGLLDE